LADPCKLRLGDRKTWGSPNLYEAELAWGPSPAGSGKGREKKKKEIKE